MDEQHARDDQELVGRVVEERAPPEIEEPDERREYQPERKRRGVREGDPLPLLHLVRLKTRK